VLVWAFWGTEKSLPPVGARTSGRSTCSLVALPSTLPLLLSNLQYVWGHAMAQLVRQCATSNKVTGSIPNGVIGIFHLHNPSGRTMTLGSIKPL
jgi:hypothetical protein